MHVRTLGLLVAALLMLGASACIQRPADDPSSQATSRPPSPATAERSPARPPRNSLEEAMQLRMHGQLEEAMKVLRAEYARSKNVDAWRQLLGVMEDTGKAEDEVAEAQAFLAKYPNDPYGEWMLARGLLFEAASAPGDAQNKKRIEDAEQIAGRLEKAGYKPPGDRGGIHVIRMQVAYLRHQWHEADKLAGEALKEGVTSGESADILSLRFLMAVLDADMARAEKRLDEIQVLVDGYTQHAFYMLRAFREELLIVRMIFFDKPFTTAQIDNLALVHRDLRKLALADPTLPQDDEVTKTHDAMRLWLQMGEKGDIEGQLALIEKGLAEERAWKPRCFYSEALEKPFRPFYYHLCAGDLARKLKKDDVARRHYEAALAIFPDDRLLEQRLASVK